MPITPRIHRHGLALGLTCALLATGSAAAVPQDLRSPDTRDAATAEPRGLRSPDTRVTTTAIAPPTWRDLPSAAARLNPGVATTHAAVAASARDLRSPDARDAAGPAPAPVTVVPVRVPVPVTQTSDGGTDWTAIAFGAGGYLLLVGLIMFGTRRNRSRARIAV